MPRTLAIFLIVCLAAAGCGPSTSNPQANSGSTAAPVPLVCTECDPNLHKKSTSVDPFFAGKRSLTEDDFGKITQRLAKSDKPLDWTNEFGDKTLDASFLRKLLTSEQRFPFGIRIQNAPIDGTIEFSYQTVVHRVELNNCQFRDTLNLKGSVFQRGLECKSAQFFDKVDMDYLQSDGVIDVQKSHFHHEVRSRFIKVRMLDVTSCQFDRHVDFSYSELTSNLEATDGVCLDLAQFDGMKISGYAFINGRVFQGDMRFRASNVGTILFAQDCVFCRNADFQRTRAGDEARLNRSRFAGDLIFNEASLGNGLNMMDTSFGQGKVDLSYLSVLHLNLAPKVGANAFTSFDLRGIDVKGKFELDNVVLQQLDLRFSTIHTIDFYNIEWPKQQKDRQLEGMSYQDIVDRTGNYSDIRALLSGAPFSNTPYTNLQAYLAKQGNQALALEVFWEMKTRQSDEHLAKWRIQDFNISELFSYVWGGFLRIFVGYGAYPENALAWGALIVLIGMCVFRRRFMERTEKAETAPVRTSQGGCDMAVFGMNPSCSGEHSDRKPFWRPMTECWRRFVNWLKAPGREYSSFWYSLDLFVPAINLEAAKSWRPKQEHWIIWQCFRIQKILGWIIIPIGLVAWSGIVKL